MDFLKEEILELSQKYEKVQADYQKYKENLSGKDKWIIKQGDEIINLKGQVAKLRKAYSGYKTNIEGSTHFFGFII